jgi:serine/threonine-protein kinase
MASDELVLDLIQRWEDLRRAGTPTTPEKLCAERPELLAAVRDGVWGLKELDPFLETIDRSVTGPMSTDDPSLPPLAAFANERFRPLHFHRRGGQGEVYLAHDTDLDRPVALKRMLPRLGLSPGARRRFAREAAVCGRLQHPGTVPVYGLGTDAAGRPYYAMRFVEGESLADAVRRFHQDLPNGVLVGAAAITFRQLLTRFGTVCQTIAYAHSQGVIHRDLKPHNILLGPFGETLVVDWGLAKVVEQKAEDRSQRPDDGRPAPMSPVNGRLSTDPTSEMDRTEIGAIVGTAAYMSPEQARGATDEIGPASDVYGLGATLYALLTGGPPVGGANAYEALEEVQRGAIVPPRRKAAWVPTALDAVCRKALAANPADRYASALDLAADLERWLADEPVTCLRESSVTRARRWVRRHARLATGAAAAVVVGALALGLLAWQNNRARRAVEAERDATDRQRLRAVAARDHTRAALDAMTSTVTGDALSVQPALSREQRRFLESVLRYYQEFAAEPGEDREGRERLADAHERLGLIRARLGQAEEAVGVFERSVELHETLVSDYPDKSGCRAALARSRTTLGNALAGLGKPAEAESAYRAALAEQEKLAASERAPPEYRRDMGRTYANLGILRARLGRWEEAEAGLRAALVIQEPLAAEQRVQAEYRRDLARSYTNLGNLLAARGRPSEAEDAYRAAGGAYEPLVKDHSDVSEYRNELAAAQNNLGHLLARLARWSDAEDAYRDALAVRERLATDYPGVPAYAVDLGGTCCNLGDLLRDRGDPTASLPWFARAFDILNPIQAREPRAVTARLYLRSSHWGRAVALGRLDRYTDAIADWDRAVELSDPAERDGVRILRADARVRAGDHTTATAEADTVASTKGAAADSVYGAACIYALASARTETSLADRYAARVVALLRRAIAAGFSDFTHLKTDPDLISLRGRPDFRELLAGLRGGG